MPPVSTLVYESNAPNNSKCFIIYMEYAYLQICVQISTFEPDWLKHPRCSLAISLNKNMRKAQTAASCLQTNSCWNEKLLNPDKWGHLVQFDTENFLSKFIKRSPVDCRLIFRETPLWFLICVETFPFGIQRKWSFQILLIIEMRKTMRLYSSI